VKGRRGPGVRVLASSLLILNAIAVLGPLGVALVSAFKPARAILAAPFRPPATLDLATSSPCGAPAASTSIWATR